MPGVNSDPALERFYWDAIVGPRSEAERLRKLNGLFSHHANALLAALGRAAPCPIFVGGYPTHSANAFASQQEGGAIILVHEGLLEVAFILSKILAAAVPGDEDAPELSERAANALIAAAVTGLVGDLQPVPYVLRSTSRVPFAQFLNETLVDFVLAHELAHVLLGHTDDADGEVTTAAGREIGISIHAWQQEMAADVLAFQIVAATLPDRIGTESRYMPAVVFFELLECEAHVRRPRGRRPADLEHVPDLATHPSAASRRSALVVSTHPDGPNARMPRVDVLVERMAAARGRPLRRPQREALGQLERRAASCDARALEPLLGLGRADAGVTAIDTGPLSAFLAADVERAKGALALTAFGVATSGYATRELFRFHLGTVFLCAPTVVREDRELLALVEACVRDLDAIVRDVARMAH